VLLGYTVKVHHATVRAFCPPEGVSTLKGILRRILPMDYPIEEIRIEAETEGGVFTKEMYKLRSRLTRMNDIQELAAKIIGHLDEYDRKKMREKLSDYMDDECNLYIRLSKSELVAGNMVLEYKDPVHVTFKIAAYPAKRENALAGAKELVESAIQ
jgi:RNA binding exosome subunit